MFILQISTNSYLALQGLSRVTYKQKRAYQNQTNCISVICQPPALLIPCDVSGVLQVLANPGCLTLRSLLNSMYNV